MADGDRCCLIRAPTQISSAVIQQRDNTQEKVDEGDVSRMIGFAFLAPDIVEAIVHGRQPIELTAEKLKRQQNLPSAWSEQRHALGFSSQA